jgi:hypothetical protein
MQRQVVRLREEEELVRRRLAQVHADIGKLVEVLKSLGSRGLASVQAELDRLEGEERQLKDTQVQLARRQEPVEQVSDNARAFLESWQDIGELLESATPEEQMQLLQHYIEEVELGAIDRQTRTGPTPCGYFRKCVLKARKHDQEVPVPCHLPRFSGRGRGVHPPPVLLRLR